MNISQEYSDIYKICNMIHTLTQMDIQFIDEKCQTIIQFTKHRLPTAFCHPKEQYHEIMDLLKRHSANNYYHYIDEYHLEYIACSTENLNPQGFLLIGPFISILPTDQLISDILLDNKISICERTNLKEFYSSLLVISSSYAKYMGELMTNLCNNPFSESTSISDDIIKPLSPKENLIEKVNASKIAIEYRYKTEKEFLNAVSKGDIEGVNSILLKNEAIFDIGDRILGNPIRSSKNLAFVLNTLLRMAAEKGGLHPVYVHNLSERFAIIIEHATSIPYLEKLEQTMFEEYCHAVRVFSTNKYSSIVKKAVDYINLNLDSHLTLKGLADIIHVNASHLSRQFKKETDMTITYFINKKRIEESKFLLERDSHSITEIALILGFSNINYFGKVFKKITSMTPSEYIQQFKKNFPK
ncbi:MAG: helix-turn-helix domain-containing protein [Clostridiales bacterium]|nr:helix-turn-helix domain-containing protein [Clostridiales bacterium]